MFEDDFKMVKVVLMVEIMNVYIFEFVKSFGKDGGEGWVILFRCMVVFLFLVVCIVVFNLIFGEFVVVLNSGLKL